MKSRTSSGSVVVPSTSTPIRSRIDCTASSQMGCGSSTTAVLRFADFIERATLSIEGIRLVVSNVTTIVGCCLLDKSVSQGKVDQKLGIMAIRRVFWPRKSPVRGQASAEALRYLRHAAPAGHWSGVVAVPGTKRGGLFLAQMQAFRRSGSNAGS